MHNDLPTNDWNTLSRNLSGSRVLSCEISRRPARCLRRAAFSNRSRLPASITLGTSGSAAHWLSRQPPDLDMPRSLYRSDAPPAERAKILKQAAADWQAFLAARAEELQPGGVLLVQMLGSDGRTDPVRVSAAGLLRLMNRMRAATRRCRRDSAGGLCALLLSGGAAHDRRGGSACHGFARGQARIAALRADAGAVALSGLRSTGPAMSRRSRRATPPSPAPSARAACGTGCFRYGKASADALADQFYAAMEQALTARPRDYPFDDLTLAIIVRRRG